ncbi:MAG: PQQ-dependent sugar dehydrogenase [Gemmatimonadales bacterium]|nr:PQQ-dependent sugar dehydrogenase [Gemmatimonadales bacterium]
MPVLPALALLLAPPPAKPACRPDDGGLTLDAGLCATVLASDLGPVRHLVVAPNGDLFAAVEGPGGGITALRDADGDGVAETRKRFGPGGGHGIALSATHLYFSTSAAVYRWAWTRGQLEPQGEPEVVVRDLPTGGHRTKSLVLHGDTLFVNVGSQTNSCQAKDRAERSPGLDPCTELETRAGVWAFSATRTGQRLADGTRYATGLRNAVAMAIEPGTRTLWVGTHGRDQLGQNWGYPDSLNAELPAEEVGPAPRGADYGWPFCYYDGRQQRKVLAPEYGGDGQAVGRCRAASTPAVAFPAHWAPIALAFLPPDALGGGAWGGGALVSWHGSWNRAPLPQQGFRVSFVPMQGGKPSGPPRTFAIGRAGETWLRASGLAVAPDGGVYVASDARGTVWKVVRRP